MSNTRFNPADAMPLPGTQQPRRPSGAARTRRTWGHSSAAWVAVLVPFSLAFAGEQASEVRPRHRWRDGTPQVWDAYMRHPSRKASAALPHIADQDLHNIAVLVDDGTLVIAGATNTDNIAARFYASHGDDYDFINVNVASSFAPNVEPEAGFAFEQNIANSVTGINLIIFNSGSSVAPGVTRLRSILNMNDLGEYNENPGEKLPGFLNTYSGVDILGQEAGHMVAAFVTASSADILGRGNSHWSYFFHTYGSTLEGNGWQDNGNGTYTTISSGDGYSQLDNYLWGFLASAGVTDPMYVITNPVPAFSDAVAPAEGLTVSGTRVDVTIAHVITNHGLRTPTPLTSQKTYRMAWILVVPGTGIVPDHDLEKIDDFRTQWEEEFFPQQTNNVGTMVSQIGAGAAVTANFEARVVEGEPGLTIEFDNDSFGSTSSFLWSFGDGNTSTERHPTHTYTTSGAFDVTLTVNGLGGPAMITKSDFIRVGTRTCAFEDDFETDQGWTNAVANTATAGNWLRADPVGTVLASAAGTYGTFTVSAALQLEDDHTAIGTQCLVTGNANPGDGAGVADVDGGVTSILSPNIDLGGVINPVLSFWAWFSNSAGASPGVDFFFVDVSSDGGTNWTTVKTLHSAHYFWREEQVRLAGLVALTSTMRVRFRTADEGAGSLVEAGVDDVKIFEVDDATDVGDFASARRFALTHSSPNPFVNETTLRFAVPSPGSRVALRVYSVDGKLVRTLLEANVDPGVHTSVWNGRDDAGGRVANGVYLYRLQTPHESLTRKVYYVR